MTNFQPEYKSEGSFSPDKLIAGDATIVTRSITLVSGQNLARGSVLGRITASGKYTLSASALTNGAQTPVAILAEDVDASGGDKTTLAYESGVFNEGALTFGAGHTADSTRTGLRQLGIFMKTTQPA